MSFWYRKTINICGGVVFAELLFCIKFTSSYNRASITQENEVGIDDLMYFICFLVEIGKISVLFIQAHFLENEPGALGLFHENNSNKLIIKKFLRIKKKAKGDGY